MVLVTVIFAGGRRETFPVRVPPGAMPGDVGLLACGEAARRHPGDRPEEVLAARTGAVLWTRP
jgi:hypothetical protein